jgi:site-specific DNA-cytosine methylase
MTFGSLFSGIGGIDLGLERRWSAAGKSRSIRFAGEVLAKHWPQVKRYATSETLTAPVEPSISSAAASHAGLIRRRKARASRISLGLF